MGSNHPAQTTTPLCAATAPPFAEKNARPASSSSIPYRAARRTLRAHTPGYPSERSHEWSDVKSKELPQTGFIFASDELIYGERRSARARRIYHVTRSAAPDLYTRHWRTCRHTPSAPPLSYIADNTARGFGSQEGRDDESRRSLLFPATTDKKQNRDRNTGVGWGWGQGGTSRRTHHRHEKEAMPQSFFEPSREPVTMRARSSTAGRTNDSSSPL